MSILSVLVTLTSVFLIDWFLRRRVDGLLVGNTTEKVFDTRGYTVRRVKPDDFVSPMEPASMPVRRQSGE